MNGLCVIKKLKTVIVNFAVVYPTLTLLQALLLPLLEWLPLHARQAVLVLVMCVVLTFAMPLVQRLLALRAV